MHNPGLRGLNISVRGRGGEGVQTSHETSGIVSKPSRMADGCTFASASLGPAEAKTER